MSQVIALDIGGTNIRVALINDKYQIVKVNRATTTVGDKKLFLSQVHHSIVDLDVEINAVKAIGIGVPGRVRPDGNIDTLPNIKIQSIPLADYLKDRLSRPIYVRNDAEMAAIAEANLGVGKGKRSTFFVTISTGLGGALVRDGSLAYSSDEIGHTLVFYKGKYHELEQLASGSGIVRLCALNGIEIGRPQDFFARITQGDTTIAPVYEDWLTIIADFFKMVQRLFEPDVIALTGGVTKSQHVFFDRLQRMVPEAKLKMAAFGEDAGLIGAATYAFNK